jgi:hypothetical protein
LRDEGYEVNIAVTVAEVAAVCESRPIDVTVIGAAVGPIIKMAILDRLRQSGSNSSIIEMGQTQPFIPNAISVASCSAEELLRAIRVVLRSRAGKGPG